MPITHDDILNKEFPIRFRGYDTDEVDAFLEDVAKEVAALTKENNRLNEEQVRLRKELEELKREESELRQAVLSAHRLAEEMKGQLVSERKLMVEKAKVEVDKIVAEARNELSRLQTKIEELKRLKQEMAARLKATLEGYLRLLADDDDEGPTLLGSQLLEEIGEEVKQELETLGLSMAEATRVEPTVISGPGGAGEPSDTSKSARKDQSMVETEEDQGAAIKTVDLGPALD